MKTAHSCKVWTLSSDRNEYERFVYLLGKPEEDGLSIDLFNELLQERAVPAYVFRVAAVAVQYIDCQVFVKRKFLVVQQIVHLLCRETVFVLPEGYQAHAQRGIPRRLRCAVQGTPT